MDKIAKLETRSIGQIVQPTFGAYVPLQLARKEEIFEHAATEHQYGKHDRQKLDVYMPPSASAQSGSKLPCIIFAYGGGLTQGDKRIAFAQNVLYANVGQYFSSRGFVTVLPDYRLYGVHDAKYPSGGEDIGLALDWVVKNLDSVNKDSIFLIGNSAGGVHIATWLYSPEISSDIPRHAVRGVVFAQVPFHFRKATDDRTDILDGYYGKGKVEERSPLNLRRNSKDNTDASLLLAEFEPEDEILETNRDFLALFPIEGVNKPEMLPEISGHNHISAFLSLGLGGKEDSWTAPLLQWIKSRC